MAHPQILASYQSIPLAFLTYLVLCRLLRYAWMSRKQAKYPYKDRASFAKMTVTDAQDIQWYLYQLEFPFTTQKAVEFARWGRYGSFRNVADGLHEPRFCALFMNEKSILIPPMMVMTIVENQ